MRPRQILDLGKQFNVMVHLENVLKTSFQDVLKMSWRRLKSVLKKVLQDVLKTFWRGLEEVLAKRPEDVLEDDWKTFLQDV